MPVREYIVKAFVTLVLACVALAAIVTAFSRFQLRPTEISMSSGGMSVKLERQLPNGTEYFIAVSPQVGWQDTDIEIKADDEVEFWASGQVNLSIYRVNESVATRRQVEASVTCVPAPAEGRSCTDPRARAYADSLRRDSLVTPEAFYTTEEYERIRPRQPWVGPDGDEITADRSVRGRTRNKLAPPLPYGQLVGIILPKAEDPDARNAVQVFGIGRTLESAGGTRPTKKTGDLWLAINDVWNGRGKRTGSAYPDNLFLLDNAGFFWVRIRVIHR
ncbi:hypothetical protein [Longimicrobium sp.]|uniref:hypothetical protein n=1 Tax=Longimicrobium sp. TaxID=2029185 RepID=UPI002E330A97|nr:hypothetical protein [Longimicrobium sp.]HEX6037702.1 hypothetical protein [Longimicrobium sp.]